MTNEIQDRNLEELSRLNDAELIQYILERFHDRHRDQLKAIIDDADKVVTVHRDHALCPTTLAVSLREMAGELELHMLKEENILFPMIHNGEGAFAVGPISVMSSEHEMHLAAIETLEELVADAHLPHDACPTWRRLFKTVQELITDLKTHIQIENDILFAR
jgi:regulator of cell morphogenesis and NO signaling